LITGNLIEYDSSGVCGGGIYGAYEEVPLIADYTGPIVYNNVIRNNYASSGGGGISFGHSGKGILVNNIIYGNQGTQGGGFYNYGQRGTKIINCIFWGNQANLHPQISNGDTSGVVSYCDVEGGYLGVGNIDIDPLFGDPINGDFHLMSMACGDSADSPCIDAGHPDSVDAELHCLAGLGTLRADMGAYGGGGNLTGISPENPPLIPSKAILSQNYPNPFNPTTTISYNLPQASHVTLEIYDILGRKVEMLVDEEQAAGPHQAVWNAGDRASGIYFYRIQAGNIIETKRMLLLK
jgi:parallel beta-helix repeat protein